MAAQVLSFFQRSPRHAPAPADWSQQELAEFYRVEGALIRAGIRVGTDRGLSDENEPWFVFYRSDDGEVVIHFARIDGEYLIAGPAYEEIARGFDFTALVRNLVARHPLIRRSESNSNLSIHPAALLVAVVGTAFFKTGEARAAETGATNGHAAHSRPVLLSSSSNAGLTNVAASFGAAPAQDSVQLPANQAVLILAAAMFASDYRVDTTSLDPAAHAAISAAAAALDFGSAPAALMASPQSGVVPSATAHVAAVDNTPVQTVSSVLSLVAILATMPHATEAPASAQGVLSVATESSRHSLPLSLPPASAEAANWALDVRLNASLNGLPSVEAIQLIRSLAGEAGGQKISVIEVSKLPDVLAELIAKGDHYNVTPALAPAPSVDTPPAVADPTPATPVENVGAPAHPDPTPTPAEPLPPASTPAPTPTFADIDIVRQFIDYFIAHTTGIEVMAKGTEIVMFDVRVLHEAGSIALLDSMTFHFNDGGSISLVGDHSSFLNDGILF